MSTAVLTPRVEVNCSPIGQDILAQARTGASPAVADVLAVLRGPEHTPLPDASKNYPYNGGFQNGSNSCLGRFSTRSRLRCKRIW